MLCLWHWHDQAQIWHSANVKCPLLNEEERWTAWPFWELTVTSNGAKPDIGWEEGRQA